LTEGALSTISRNDSYQPASPSEADGKAQGACFSVAKNHNFFRQGHYHEVLPSRRVDHLLKRSSDTCLNRVKIVCVRRDAVLAAP
jgi:hypothetical protein